MSEKLYHVCLDSTCINKFVVLDFIDSLLNKFISFANIPPSEVSMSVPCWFLSTLKIAYPYLTRSDNKYGLISIIPDNRKTNFVTIYSGNKYCNFVLVAKVFY